MFRSGYVNLELEELLKLLPYEIEDKLQPNINVNIPQVALDVLSVLIMTKDNYDDPLLKLEEHLYTFFTDVSEVSRVKPTIVNIVGDFNNFLAAYKQSENTV